MPSLVLSVCTFITDGNFPDVANVGCSVVVPKLTPKVKCDAIEGYGAELTLCEKPTDRKPTCDKVLFSIKALLKYYMDKMGLVLFVLIALSVQYWPSFLFFNGPFSASFSLLSSFLFNLK